MDSHGHWFWGILTFLCVAWYSTITFLVAFKGAGDIKQMFRRLALLRGNEEPGGDD